MDVDVEPVRRRSTRSTRGKHSRYDNEEEEHQPQKPMPKPKKGTSEKKKEKDQGEGVVRCPCGATEDDGEAMIECEECLEWQHSNCVLPPNKAEQVPDHYVCDTCTDKAVDKTNNESKENNELDKHAIDAEDVTYQPSEESHNESVGQISKSTNKRVGKIDDITEKVRKSAAFALKGIFTSVPTSKYSTLSGQPSEEFCEMLALNIEQELYDAYGVVEPEIGSNYRDKFRTLSFNLRDQKNETLLIRVMTNAITPKTLVAMSSEEMMNPELQKLAEEVRAEAIRESILVVDEAPRLRRTHKGEEIVGDYEDYIDNVDLALKTEKQRDGDNEKAQVAKGDLSSESADKNHATNVDADSMEDASKASFPTIPKWKYDMDLGMDESDNEQDQTNDDSDHDDKVNDILGDVTKAAREAETDDWNIISKAPFVWSGTVPMLGLDSAQCTAFSLGSSSAHFDGNVSWGSIFYASKPLLVEGRLDKSKADPYLSKVLGSGTRDIAALALLPADSEQDQNAYNQLYEYFQSRSKYGVIHNRSSNVKDAYLIPLAPDQTPPYVLGSLVQPSVELSELKRSRHLLIVLYVVGKLSPKRPVAVVTEAHAKQAVRKPRTMREHVRAGGGKPSYNQRGHTRDRPVEYPVPHEPTQPKPAADLVALQSLLQDPSLQGKPTPPQADLLQNPALLMSLINQAKNR